LVCLRSSPAYFLGHSTIDYVLGRDANEAALSWARQIDTALGGTAETPGRVLDKDVQVLDPASFQQNLASIAGKPRAFPPIRASLSVASV